MSRYGLVLAGGGGKGAYQIGAWKALREMGITFDAIAGASIGSINGALIAAGDYDKAMEMWKSVSLDKGVKINAPLPDPDNLFSKKNWGALFREVIRNGGIDASPLNEYIKIYIDEKKIRESNIPLGIITVQMGQKVNGLELFIDEIPEGELVDYLLASSSIPLVTNIGPDGEKFLDGGVYDNTPVMTLKKRGYNNLIVIDIANIKGVAYNLNFANSRVVHIKPYDTDDLGAAFDFDPALTEKRMTMGYLDAKKAFGELSGNIFHFLPLVFRSFVQKYGADEVYELEQLGHRLGLSLCEIYSEESFMFALKEAYEKEKAELLAKEKAKEAEKAEKAEKSDKAEKAEKSEKASKGEKPDIFDLFTRAARREKDEQADTSAQPSFPFPIISAVKEEETKEEETGHFNLAAIKNYFAQKKSNFEGFETAIDIIEKFSN